MVQDPFYKDLENTDMKTLEFNIAQMVYGPPDSQKSRTAIAVYERRKFEQIQEINKKNVSATRWLVIATWGLVLVTCLLVWVTFKG